MVKGVKPLDLFPAFVPETITVPNGFNPDKASQKGYQIPCIIT